MLNLQTFSSKAQSKTKLLIFIFSVLILGLTFFSNTVNAQSSNLRPATAQEKAEIAKQVYESNCPDPIKRLIIQYDERGNLVTTDGNPMAVDGDLYLDGTYIVARTGSGAGNPVYLTCANASFFEQIIIRIFIIIFSLVGLVIAFGIGRSAITIITALDDSDKREAGIKGVVTAVMYTIGLIFTYTIFVFVAVGIFGVGTGAEKPEYNLFCQNRIVINLTFNSTDKC